VKETASLSFPSFRFNPVRNRVGKDELAVPHEISSCKSSGFYYLMVGVSESLFSIIFLLHDMKKGKIIEGSQTPTKKR